MTGKDSIKAPEETEDVIIKDGLFKVHPDRMEKHIKQQEMTDEERHQIAKMRREYLNHIHDHFANKILKPRPKHKEE
jgi:hypothetical protein